MSCRFLEHRHDVMSLCEREHFAFTFSMAQVSELCKAAAPYEGWLESKLTSRLRKYRLQSCRRSDQATKKVSLFDLLAVTNHQQNQIHSRQHEGRQATV